LEEGLIIKTKFKVKLFSFDMVKRCPSREV